jgi:hypothetical protein
LMSEGTVYRRKDGRWCAKWKDASGKWRYLYRKSKAEAKQALREALRDRDDNIVPANKLTLNDALDAWLDSMRDTISERTYVNREALVRIHVQSHPVGSLRLCNLTGDHLRCFRPGEAAKPITVQCRTATQRHKLSMSRAG